MLVNAPAMSAAVVGNTGVITSAGTNDGVFGDRTGDFGVGARSGDLYENLGLEPRTSFALTSGLPPRSRANRLGGVRDGSFGEACGSSFGDAEFPLSTGNA